MIIFTTSSNPILGKRAAAISGARVGAYKIKRFSDGEPRFQITSRPSDGGPFAVFGSLQQPEANLIEMLWLLNAVEHWSGQKARAVIPYLGYSRQDRSEPPGTAVSAELVAKFLSAAGAKGVAAIDVHSPRVPAYYSIPLTNIPTADIFAEEIKKMDLTNTVLAAPDHGARERALAIAKALNMSNVIVIKKYRAPGGEARALEFEGEVKGKNVCLIDDIIDTGGTLIEAARLLKKAEAKKFMAAATHGIFSQNALDNLRKNGFEKILTTNTIPHNRLPVFVKEINVASVLARELSV